MTGGPTGDRLIGRDVLVAPQSLPQIDVLGDLGGGLYRAESLQDDVCREISVSVQHGVEVKSASDVAEWAQLLEVCGSGQRGQAAQRRVEMVGGV